MDQSSGHGKKMEGGLNAMEMGVRFGGCQQKMRNTTINELGNYPAKLNVGGTQSLSFISGDEGPFYLSAEEREGLKHDTFTGEKKILNKTKKMLVEEIKRTGYKIRGHLSKDELERIAKEKNIALTYEFSVKKEGWMGKPKGLLQILWERGFIDENNLHLYSLKGKKKQLDDNGKLQKEFEQYSLRTLMSRCSDFANEKSAMEHLFMQLSEKGEQTLKMLTSPKYHCELAGEGVEYAWGFMKRHFRNLCLKEKKTKEKFNKAVRDSVELVSVKNLIMFAGRCRRYMVTYLNFEKEGRQKVTFDMIEKYTRQIKTHRNVADIEKAFIAKAWREAIGMVDD